MYSKEGNIVVSNYCTDHTKNLGDYGRAQIKLTEGENIIIYAPYEANNFINELSNPIFHVLEMESNKEYTIKNTSDKHIIIDNNFIFQSFSIKYYNSVDEMISEYDNISGQIIMKEYESIKISTRDKNGKLYIPYEIMKSQGDNSNPIYKPEDFNKDGKIDIEDLSLMALKYNKEKNQSGWDIKYDLNKDNIIDIFDLAIMSKKL